MAPYSSTDQENRNNKVNYENNREIKHQYVIKHEINDKQNEKLTKEDYSNYFKDIQNYTTMATYVKYMPQQIYNFPITINDWNPIILPTSVYTTAVHQVAFGAIPQTINPSIISTLCPCGTVITEPMIPVVSPTGAVITETVPVPESYYKSLVYVPETITPPVTIGTNNKEVHEDTVNKLTPELFNSDGIEESIDCYLRLPKELFPTPRMFTIDPNQIIDVFCDQEDISDHTPWLLDLEFGLPRVAVTRHIPIYDVQFNRIHCKNTPSAIHPGFERCSKAFKRELLFYYDCIVSTWYKGFVAMKNDTSVNNFQTWLLKAMQVFGMCWP